MNNRTRKSSSKHCFLLEDGELSDIEDEDKAEKELEQQRKDNFIRDWTERQNANTSAPEAEMDVDSDSEEIESKIDTKPVAMTITFHDENFAKSNRGVIETQMVMKFSPVMVDSNDTCIFVLHEHKTVDLAKSVTAPLGVMSIVFHDEAFCSEYSKFMLNLCQSMFGVSKTTSHEPWLIEVVQNDFLNFEVDTTPFGRDGLPIYSKKESGMLAEKQEKKGGARQTGSCFNCLGSHSLRECPRPRNARAINENRKKFMENKAKQGRYHAEVDRYSEFIPGQISKELQEALGLSETQIPRHIYRMRKYGYPPGWLLEAKIAHSGVTVYGKDGIVFEEGDEDGEIVDEGKDLYDIKKLVAFPGFNVPLPEGVIDEHEAYHCPPMSEEQSFEKLKEKLAPNAMQAYKRRKARNAGDEGGSESGDNDADLPSPAGRLNESTVSSSDDRSNSQSSSQATPRPAAKPVLVNLGTPILASHSPFNKLPNRDKFATDVSDVINFENLPDSTGTYEKMIGSIAKIREYNSQNN